MAPDAGSAHLLLVDDDLTGLGLIINYLRDYDFAVSTAVAALEGLAQARRYQPDLILLDLSLPDASGFEVLETLKATPLTAAIPVVLLTARNDVESKVRGFDLGAVDYLTKPVEEAELHARVTVHVRRQRLQGSLERRLRAFEQRFGALDGDRPGEARSALARQEVERLCQARQILREQLANPPSLTDLAHRLGTNQPQLSRGFRALFGTTVYGFVREARLRRARELLTGTTWPVKTIALEVGYRNTSDLTHSVKARFGLTPSKMRSRSCAETADS